MFGCTVVFWSMVILLKIKEQLRTWACQTTFLLLMSSTLNTCMICLRSLNLPSFVHNSIFITRSQAVRNALGLILSHIKCRYSLYLLWWIYRAKGNSSSSHFIWRTTILAQERCLIVLVILTSLAIIRRRLVNYILYSLNWYPTAHLAFIRHTFVMRGHVLSLILIFSLHLARNFII
jgi:hypothetical protein